jgi:hypothetical protein
MACQGRRGNQRLRSCWAYFNINLCVTFASWYAKRVMITIRRAISGVKA